MKCPNCQSVELTKTQREGFELDHCPECRGIWFERGEIEKIIGKMKTIDEGLHFPPSEVAENKEAAGASAIMDSIYSEKELHHHATSKNRHHWMHRLFD